MRNISIDTLSDFHWKNFSWQLANYAVSGMSVVFLWILLARVWNLEDFGQFSLIFAWTAIYGLVMELGLDFWVTKKASTHPNQAFSTSVIIFRIVSALCLGVAFFFVGKANGYDSSALFLFLSGAFVLNIAHFFSCYLRATERLSVEAILSILRNVFYVSSAGIGVFYGANIEWVGISYLCANIAFFVFICFVLRHFKFKVALHFYNLLDIVKQSLPVWVSGMLVGLSLKTDLILLGEFSDNTVVARFNAAIRIFEGCMLLATAFVLTLFPLLSRESIKSQSSFYVLIRGYGRLLFIISLLLSLATIGFATVGFTWLFGQEYQESQAIFILLMIFFPCSVLSYFLYNSLIIAMQTWKVIMVLVSAVVINVVINAVFIPVYQMYGALLAFLTKELILLFAFLWLSSREMRVRE